MNQGAYKKKVRAIRFSMTLVKRAYRNKSWLDKACRLLMARMMPNKPSPDFMEDEMIANDSGYDPEELIRYENGE